VCKLSIIERNRVMDTDKVVLSSNPEGNQADCHEIVTHYSPSPGYFSIPTNDDCFLCFPLYASVSFFCVVSRVWQNTHFRYFSFAFSKTQPRKVALLVLMKMNWLLISPTNPMKHSGGLQNLFPSPTPNFRYNGVHILQKVVSMAN